MTGLTDTRAFRQSQPESVWEAEGEDTVGQGWGGDEVSADTPVPSPVKGLEFRRQAGKKGLEAIHLEAAAQNE